MKRASAVFVNRLDRTTSDGYARHVLMLSILESSSTWWRRLSLLGPAAARRRRRLVGRVLTFAVLASPFFWSLTFDLTRRAGTLLRLGKGPAWFLRASMGFTLVFWMALLWPAASRRGVVRHV